MCLQMLGGESVVNGPASGLPSPDAVIVWLTEWSLLLMGRPPCVGKADSADPGTERSLVRWIEAMQGRPEMPG